MFSFGVLLPGFVFFGWTRSSKDIEGSMIYGPAGLVRLDNGTGSGSGGSDVDFDIAGSHEGQGVLTNNNVILFGESDKGRDSDKNVTNMRNFVRQVIRIV